MAKIAGWIRSIPVTVSGAEIASVTENPDSSAISGSISAMVAANTGSAESRDRKSTRLNSSHMSISYAVFCLKKKKNKTTKAILSQTHPNEHNNHDIQITHPKTKQHITCYYTRHIDLLTYHRRNQQYSAHTQF